MNILHDKHPGRQKRGNNNNNTNDYESTVGSQSTRNAIISGCTYCNTVLICDMVILRWMLVNENLIMVNDTLRFLYLLAS